MKNVMYLSFLYLTLILLQACTGGGSTGTRGSSGGSGSSIGSTDGGAGSGGTGGMTGNPGGSTGGSSGTTGGSGGTTGGSGGTTGGSGGTTPSDPYAWRNRYLKKISAGVTHTCAIISNKAYCWGNKADGKLGIANMADAPNYFAPNTLVNGKYWGSVAEGDLGLISPNNPHYFIHISAGNRHTCGLTEDNRAFCWGFNNFGQLGIGNTTNQQMPELVGGANSTYRFALIEAGANFTCGITLEKRLLCWGYNNVGQLGDNSLTNRNLPSYSQEVSTLFENISLGYYHACGLGSDKKVYCWGQNANGRTGAGPNPSSANYKKPTKIEVDAIQDWNYEFVAVATDHSCAITEGNRTIYCWGLGGSGRLGNGSTANLTLPTLNREVVPANPSENLRSWALSAGDNFTCALQEITGEVHCWGANGANQLGNGTIIASTMAVPVNDPAGFPLTSNAGNDLWFQQISSGSSHSCAWLQNKVYCWGYNDNLKSGKTSGASVSSPTEVVFPSN